MKSTGKIHSCGQPLKGVEEFCPRCGKAVVWKNETTQHKPLVWCIAGICVITIIILVVVTGQHQHYANPEPQSTTKPAVEPLPDSFGWFEFEAPVGPKAADGKPSLSIVIWGDHIHERDSDGTFIPSTFVKPEWLGHYRVMYKVVEPSERELVIHVPDGDLSRKSLLNGKIRNDNFFQFYSTGKTSVQMIAGAIRNDFPTDKLPAEEVVFLNELLVKKHHVK